MTDSPQTQAEPRAVLAAGALALALGVIFTVVFVLPAEYGVDLTGLGDRLGLTALAAPPGDLRESGLAENPPVPGRARIETVIELAPGEGREFKVRMEGGVKASYRWMASAPLHFDHHGEPAGDSSGYYESYALGDSAAVQGKFTALFSGTHGWYWRNDGGEPVRVEVLIVGAVRAIDTATATSLP